MAQIEGAATEPKQQYPQHPFVTALPPATDYISYLTILEANLDYESLPLLNHLLQDERLTTNIGWDLVHLLAPLLPESGECLLTIARLGNPREVMIKVNEMLEIIGYDAHATAAAEGLDSPSDEDGEDDQVSEHHNGHGAHAAYSKATRHNERDELQVLEFRYLVCMTGVLHPRIRTKRPSKFLLTAAEGVLGAYRALSSWALLDGVSRNSHGHDSDQGPTQGPEAARSRSNGHSIIAPQNTSATNAVIDLLAAVSTVTRPPLPPRAGSERSIGQQTVAADPEAEVIDASEATLQRRILISLATQVSETLNARLRECLPPQEVSWVQRYIRERHPAQMTRQDIQVTDLGLESLLEKTQGLLRRLTATLAGSLGLKADKLPEFVKQIGQDGAAIADVEEMPVSAEGALYLWADWQFRDNTAPLLDKTEHQLIVAKYLGGLPSIDFGPQSLATIDAVMLLGWKSAAASDKIPDPEMKRSDDTAEGETQESYNEYLQQLSVISANAPFAELRYQGHLLVTRILRQTAASRLKYGFIRDTLEFCPFHNLRVTAVGWLKDEILAAFDTTNEQGDKEKSSKFAEPGTLDDVALSLFDASDADEGLGSAEPNAADLSFWLAALNLLYVVCLNERIRDGLSIATFVRKYDIKRRFVEPLETVAEQLLKGSQATNTFSDGMLLSDAVSRAQRGLDQLKS